METFWKSQEVYCIISSLLTTVMPLGILFFGLVSRLSDPYVSFLRGMTVMDNLRSKLAIMSPSEMNIHPSIAPVQI